MVWCPLHCAGTPALTYTLFSSMVLGTVYSVEPFRLKRYPALAAFCILAVRGLIVQVGGWRNASGGAGADAPCAGVTSWLTVAMPTTQHDTTQQLGFLHHIYSVEEKLGLRDANWTYPPRVVFAGVFMTLFSVVIALFKDLPDVEGDKSHGVRTYVFLACAVPHAPNPHILRRVSAGGFHSQLARGLFACPSQVERSHGHRHSLQAVRGVAFR